MERNERSVYTALGMESDPFRNGVDACCAVHTNAGRFKRALTELKSPDEDTDIARLINELEQSNRSILAAGYRMSEVCTRVYVLEMRFQ